MAREQALAKPGNVATEPVRGAQSTWLTGEMEEKQGHLGPGKESLSLEWAQLLRTARHRSIFPLLPKAEVVEGDTASSPRMTLTDLPPSFEPDFLAVSRGCAVFLKASRALMFSLR